MSSQNEAAVDQTPSRDAKKVSPTKPTGNKKDLVLRILDRKAGASLDELCKLTGWQPHSVRGFLSGTVRKKLGHDVIRRKDAKGATRYHLGNPVGQS